MRAVRFHETGGPEVLQVDEIEQPTPDKDEILVEVKAAGVNPSETYVRSDWAEYPPPQLPLIPSSDVAGDVEDVGSAVTEFDVGDRVFAAIGHSVGGGLAEYVTIPEELCAGLPDGVAYEQGAGVGTAGACAWHSLANKPRLEPGKTCLVQGGSGGVGHIGSQVAAAAGMTVIATAGSDDRCERLDEFGVDVALNYNRDDLTQAIESAAPDGVDIFLEHFPEYYFEMDVEVAAAGSHIVIFGATEKPVEISPPVLHDARSQNTTVWFTSSGAYSKGESMRKLARLLDSGDLEAEIARRYTLDEAGEAHRAVEEDSFVGRVVITL